MKIKAMRAGVRIEIRTRDLGYMKHQLTSTPQRYVGDRIS
jgi:hypothetical protein